MKSIALASLVTAAFAFPAHAQTSVDLSNYTLVGRYTLPEPTRVAAPPNSLLAQEASGVTWNRATNSLFVVGDGGTSVVQVSLTGQYIDSMTLGLNPARPQGTAYYDPEGLVSLGGGQFAIVEERDRIVSRFTYAAGTTLGYGDSQHVTLGTFAGNAGIEGMAYDPLTSGFIGVKENSPLGIFQTTIDFAAGTASNGSASTVNSINLFDPALTGLLDFADVFALSNIAGIGDADRGNLLVLSQASGRVIKVDRNGNILGTLVIPNLPTTPSISVANQQHEGMTMDDAGFLYIVAENGGGDINNPQLFVYALSPVPESEGLALMLAGFALIGVVARRRRRAV